MRITELQIIKFGRFTDRTIKFNNGFNIVFGENEAGKSTILLFIKAMLYGLPSRRGKVGELKDRERIIPWGSDKAAGRMKLEADGRRIEVYREFGKRASGDVVRVTDGDSGEDCFGGADGAEVGERLLSMSEGMFERTLWIAQDDVCMRGRNDEITSKLMNFAGTGNASEISLEEALDRLDRKERSLKARTKRNSKGEIDLLIEERDRLAAELRRTEAETEKRRKCEAEMKVLTRRINEIDRETEHLNSIQSSLIAKEKIKRVERLESCMRREMQFANTRMFQIFNRHADSGKVETLAADHAAVDEKEVAAYEVSERLNEERKSFEKNKSDVLKMRILGIGSTAAAAAICVCFAVLKSMAIALGFCAAAVVFAVLTAVLCSRVRRKMNMSETNAENMNAELGKLRTEISEAEKRTAETLELFECESYAEFKEKFRIYSEDKAKIKMCRDIYNEELGDDDYSVLKAECAELKKHISDDESGRDFDVGNINIEEKLAEISREHSDAVSRLAEIRHTIEQDNLLSAADIRAEIDGIDASLKEKQDQLSALQLAAECLENAYTKRRSDFTPQLNAEVQELLGRMTNGRHEDIKVSGDFSLKLSESGDSGSLRQAEFFSMGTYNQIYLALRLAIVRLTVPDEKRILCLDDLLITYDDIRAHRTMDMLCSMCAEDNMQIIMLTCHRRDYEYAKEMKEYNKENTVEILT